MSSSLDKMVPVFTGANWNQWHVAMQAYLRANSQWSIYEKARPAADPEEWDEKNEKTLGNIALRLTPSIGSTVAHLGTTKEVWNHLKEHFRSPSIGNAYAELSKLLNTTIPAGQHPAPTITKIQSHFVYLKDAGFDFPAPVQAMIILCKLPPTMEVVAQILSQTPSDEIKNLKPDGIAKSATLSYEQKGVTSRRTRGNNPQANKLSAVKRKPADPKFTQQQQAPKPQQQQGGSHGGASGNAPAHGQGNRNRCGGKRARARCEAAHNASFTTYIHYDGPELTVDPCALAHTPGSAHYGPPTFDNIIKAFDLAHRLGVEPSCETICTLDRIVSTASASHDQPEPGPSSLGKRPRLEERLTTVEEV